MNEHQVIEQSEKDRELTDFRITKGLARYKLPWYRKVMMRVFGRSHLFRAKYPLFQNKE